MMHDKAFGSQEARHLATNAVVGGVTAVAGVLGGGSFDHHRRARVVGAALVCAVAGHHLREMVCEARGHGDSWQDIATLVGAEDGFAIYFDVATIEPQSAVQTHSPLPVLVWRCFTCRAAVVDCGPDDDDPREREQGHAEGCGRLAAEVAAYERAPRGDR
jgi:hypothetical protein